MVPEEAGFLTFSEWADAVGVRELFAECCGVFRVEWIKGDRGEVVGLFAESAEVVREWFDVDAVVEAGEFKCGGGFGDNRPV